MPTFCSCGLVVDGTVESKDNEAEKTREIADMRIYHFSWNFLHIRCDELLTSKPTFQDSMKGSAA